MAGLLTDSDYGYGEGYGGGYGGGYGDGHGYGDGYRGGYGGGHDARGHGYGEGYGVVLGDVSCHPVPYLPLTVELLVPWDIVKVGCEAMSIDDWKVKWEKVAHEYSALVDKLVVENLIDKATAIIGE